MNPPKRKKAPKKVHRKPAGVPPGAFCRLQMGDRILVPQQVSALVVDVFRHPVTGQRFVALQVSLRGRIGWLPEDIALSGAGVRVYHPKRRAQLKGTSPSALVRRFKTVPLPAHHPGVVAIVTLDERPGGFRSICVEITPANKPPEDLGRKNIQERCAEMASRPALVMYADTFNPNTLLMCFRAGERLYRLETEDATLVSSGGCVTRHACEIVQETAVQWSSWRAYTRAVQKQVREQAAESVRGKVGTAPAAPTLKLPPEQHIALSLIHAAGRTGEA